MVILSHRLSGGWLRSIEDGFENPQISVAHDPAERLFDFEERGLRRALLDCLCDPSALLRPFGWQSAEKVSVPLWPLGLDYVRAASLA